MTRPPMPTDLVPREYTDGKGWSVMSQIVWDEEDQCWMEAIPVRDKEMFDAFLNPPATAPDYERDTSGRKSHPMGNRPGG